VSCESPRGIFDARMACEQSPECEWSEVDIPNAIVDGLEADIFSDTGHRDVDPLTVPTDATNGADIAVENSTDGGA
jgi:hypothetical protein